MGDDGADKRIDVIAMAIQMGGTVYDLEEVELCYAPQYGSAKDAVNMAGMIAANALRGDAPLAKWAELGRWRVHCWMCGMSMSMHRGIPRERCIYH